jgi:hypothetical protein
MTGVTKKEQAMSASFSEIPVFDLAKSSGLAKLVRVVSAIFARCSFKLAFCMSPITAFLHPQSKDLSRSYRMSSPFWT